jgi:hypothetical protein
LLSARHARPHPPVGLEGQQGHDCGKQQADSGENADGAWIEIAPGEKKRREEPKQNGRGRNAHQGAMAGQGVAQAELGQHQRQAEHESGEQRQHYRIFKQPGGP